MTRPGTDTRVVHAAIPSIFTFTGAEQQYVVPAGVTRVLVDARGAPGGFNPVTQVIPGCTFDFQGTGSQVLTALTVTPGATLFVNVGGLPSGTTGGFNGGGNGGAHASSNQAGSGGGGASDI